MKKRSLSYLFLFVTAFALTSCGTPNGAAVSPDGSSTAVSSSESSKAVVSGESSQTGCIKWNLLENHETLDPLVFDEPLITGLLFFGLTGIDVETLEVVPKLAESWEMNDDGTKWTFTLRDDVFWIGTNQEGNPEKLRPVNADDILLTFERGMVQDYGAGPQWMGFEIVKNWGKDDDFTIWFELNEIKIKAKIKQALILVYCFIAASNLEMPNLSNI